MLDDPQLPRSAGEGRRANATRTAIIEATLATIAAEGDDAVRVARIAKEAGVTTGALYAHFIDREDLVTAAHLEFIRRQVQTLIDSREAARADRDYTPRTSELASFLRPLLEPEPMAERRLWAEAALRARRSEYAFDDVREIIGNFIGASSEAIKSGQESGRIRRDFEAETISLVQLASTVGLAIFAELYDDSPEALDRLAKAWAQLPEAYSVTPASSGDLDPV